MVDALFFYRALENEARSAFTNFQKDSRTDWRSSKLKPPKLNEAAQDNFVAVLQLILKRTLQKPIISSLRGSAVCGMNHVTGKLVTDASIRHYVEANISFVSRSITITKVADSRGWSIDYQISPKCEITAIQYRVKSVSDPVNSSMGTVSTFIDMNASGVIKGEVDPGSKIPRMFSKGRIEVVDLLDKMLSVSVRDPIEIVDFYLP